jgi:hypothetical protein
MNTNETTTNPNLPKPGSHSLKITPFSQPGQYRTGRLVGLSDQEVHERIPDAYFSNERSADGKVTREWSFKTDGHHCGIWDYRGARFSTFGPDFVFKTLFGEAYRPD